MGLCLQGHITAEVAGTSGACIANPLLKTSRAGCTGLCAGEFWMSSVSGTGDSTASLGHLYLCWTNLTVRVFFCLNAAACGFGCACFILFFHWTPEKSLASSSLLSLLCHVGMHLVCGQLVHWESQVLLCKSILPASCPPTSASTKREGELNRKAGRRENDKGKRAGDVVGGGWECAEECRHLETLCWLQQAGFPQPYCSAIEGRPHVNPQVFLCLVIWAGFNASCCCKQWH